MSKIAIAQTGTYLLDTKRTLNELSNMAHQAVISGCCLIVFPEAYLGGYPKFMNFGTIVGTRSNQGREHFAEYANTAFTLSQLDEQVGHISKKHGITIVTGAIERDNLTLYCSVVAYDTQGNRINHRRKLMPTAQERVIWGQSQAMGTPFDTDAGRVGALICWENYMPLARMAMYQQGVEIYAAPTVDDRDNWQHSMCHIAREGCCFVFSACQYMTLEHLPDHWKEYAQLPQDNTFIRGGSCIVNPMGEYISQPVYNQTALITADIDVNDRIKAGYDLDIAGHYSRTDIFSFFWK